MVLVASQYRRQVLASERAVSMSVAPDVEHCLQRISSTRRRAYNEEFDSTERLDLERLTVIEEAIQRSIRRIPVATDNHNQQLQETTHEKTRKSE